MNFLDRARLRVANWIAPKSSASYRGARPSENHPCWHPPHRSGDSAIRDSWSVITARVRDQVRADPQLFKTRLLLIVLTLGKGVLTRANARDSNRQPIDDFNQETDYWFDQWASDEADFRRQLPLNRMFDLAFSDEVTVGNSFLIEVNNPDNEICPLSYQLLEWEQVAREYDKPGDENGGNRVVNGIEYDRFGRKAALYVYTDHPFDDLQAGYRLRRIPWRRVIHNFLPDRISADSGITWFSPQMIGCKDMDWYVSNELAAAAIAASYTMIVKSDDAAPNSVSGTLDCGSIADGSYGSDANRIEFGQSVTAYVRPDESAEIVESGRPNRDSVPFIDLMTERSAMGAGVSVQRLTGDAAGANFASIKAAHEDDASIFARVQDHAISQMIVPVRRRFTELAVAARRIKSISAQQYRNQKWRFRSLIATPPGIVSSEPLKDVEAAMARVRAGFSTTAQESARLGHYWRDNVDEQSEINDYVASKGMLLDNSKGQGVPLERSSTERPPAGSQENANAGA